MCNTCTNIFAKTCENGLCEDCNNLLCHVDKNYGDPAWILNEMANYLERLIPVKDNCQEVTVSTRPIAAVFPIAVAGKKTCSKCKMDYPATLDFFYKNSSTRDGFDPWCKKCKRLYDIEYHMRSFYRISKNEYDIMLENQKDCCACCGKPFGSSKIVIHHDHSTGTLRGLLCIPCNVILGLSHENPETLRRILRFIGD